MRSWGKMARARALSPRYSRVARLTRSPKAKCFIKGKDLLDLSAEERAREGVFLAFQYPVEIPGVSTSYFLKAAVNAVRKHRRQKELDAVEFLKLVKEKMKPC